jgi:hypothetical protein
VDQFVERLMMVGSFSSLSLGFGFMHGTIRVVWWGVDGVELKLFLG